MPRKPRIITETVTELRALATHPNAPALDLVNEAAALADKLDRYHGGSANLDPSRKAKRRKAKKAKARR